MEICYQIHHNLWNIWISVTNVLLIRHIDFHSGFETMSANWQEMMFSNDVWQKRKNIAIGILDNRIGSLELTTDVSLERHRGYLIHL